MAMAYKLLSIQTQTGAALSKVYDVVRPETPRDWQLDM